MGAETQRVDFLFRGYLCVVGYALCEGTMIERKEEGRKEEEVKKGSGGGRRNMERREKSRRRRENPEKELKRGIEIER
jgi:hypothetical protein